MSKVEVDNFLIYCGITATNTTLKKIEQKIKYIDNHFKGKLNNLAIEDIHSFLATLNKKGYAKSTRNDFTKVFKRFLKWKYKDWNTRFNELKDMKSLSNDQRKLSKDDLLSSEEMQIIINGFDSFKYKTLLLLFQETAGRPEELLKLKWKDINFKEREVKLHSSKTDKIRTIPIYKTIDHLQRFKTECFHQTPRADDKVFNLTSQAVSSQLLKVEHKLKFTKHLYPYLWRHSILTKMITKLSPKVYEMYSGHSLETGMKIYAHLDNDNLREELNEKIYNIKELSKEDKEEIETLKKKLKKVDTKLEKFMEDLKKVRVIQYKEDGAVMVPQHLDN